MFRELRRKKQALSKENCAAVLNRGTSGVLALVGDDDYPYAVPISYVYDGRSSISTVQKAAISWMLSAGIQRPLSVS